MGRTGTLAPVDNGLDEGAWPPLPGAKRDVCISFAGRLNVPVHVGGAGFRLATPPPWVGRAATDVRCCVSSGRTIRTAEGLGQRAG